MVEFGLYASLEQYSTAECLDQTVVAERTGFESVWVNDHFHPWFDRVGDGSEAHGGNCWTWLSAAYERTDSISIGPGVTAILHRHHPATVAHRLGTLTELYDDRVLFGIGTGIPLNEHVLDHPWPDFGERARRTAEAIRLIRRLFEEDHVTFDGEFWSVNDAHLYSRGDCPPIHVSASGPTSTRMAGDLGDGYWTVPELEPSAMREELFPHLERGIEKSQRNESSADVEKSINILCSYAEDERAAVQSAKPWRILLLPMTSEFPVSDPRYLQEHIDAVGIDQMRDDFLITTDPEDLVETVAEFVDVGFERVVFHSASPDQEEFCEVVESAVMPHFA